MSSWFLDTSAVIAILDRSDRNHGVAAQSWQRCIKDRIPLFTTNYVMVESNALTLRRYGTDAVRDLEESLLPRSQRYWVDEEMHQLCVKIFLGVRRRDLSLVDFTSFEVMRKLKLTTAFAFDDHFQEFGFTYP